MAEQAINTVYGLGDQPDELCSEIIRQMTARVFSSTTSAPVEPDVETDAASREGSVAPNGDSLPGSSQSPSKPSAPAAFADAFQLSQVIFIAGHCAVKQLVHLELVEREFKRRKAESDKKGGAGGEAGGEELDQVAGNVEDDIGDIIAHTKERELLYGPDSLLAIFGPMTVQICGLPKVYKVRPVLATGFSRLSKLRRIRRSGRRPPSRSASSCASAPSFASATSSCSSRSWRPPRTRRSGPTLSSRWATSPCASRPSWTRTRTGCTPA